MNNFSSTPNIILASSSTYRQRLLQQLGLEFAAISPEVDETALQQDLLLSPLEVAQTLARQKAEAVSIRYPESIVIGSDQVVDFDGQLIGKPGSRENNIELLKQFSGKTHRLITAVCLFSRQTCYAFHDQTTLSVRSLTDAEITRYVDQDQAYDCAGGYRWESAGICLFGKIETEDHTAILGLPLIRLITVLRTLGVAIP